MKSGAVLSGKYRLTERLGAGGMGAVWEAINERTGSKVALKLILHPTDDLRQRLRREAQACGRIAHRNIVQIYDVDETATGDPFLVMQLLTGQTLADLLASRRRLDPSLVARLGRDVASALAAAHAAKIIHRDLKPANIFLHREEDAHEGDEDDFVVKVVDFGVSKMLTSADVPATITDMLIGSPAYMSPEQVRVAKDLDHRTDIWSLGIVLYEMLTGKRPFSGSVEDVIRQILGAPIHPPSYHVRQLSREFDEIVARCLERDRGKRIHNATDLARMLDAVKDQRVLVSVPARVSFDGPRPTLGSDPPASSRRIPQGIAPGAMDASDIAMTVPLQKQAAPAAVVDSKDERAAADEQGAPATATLLLAAAEPIASPLPEWRRAVAARRQAAPITPIASSDELPQGGTVALLPEAVAKIAAAVPPMGAATSTTRPLVYGTASAGRAPAPAGRTSRQFLVQIGIGVVVVMALAGFVATRLSAASPEVAPNVMPPVTVPEQAEIPQTMTAKPPEPIPTMAPDGPQKAPSGPTAKPKSGPPVASTRAAATPTSIPPQKTVKPAPTTTSGAFPLPPCGKFFHKPNCR